jgi:hypothetical protein
MTRRSFSIFSELPPQSDASRDPTSGPSEMPRQHEIAWTSGFIPGQAR